MSVSLLITDYFSRVWEEWICHMRKQFLDTISPKKKKKNLSVMVNPFKVHMEKGQLNTRCTSPHLCNG